MRRRVFLGTGVAFFAASNEAKLKTPLTEMLGIRYPILQAGMRRVATPELVATVSNAGGLGILAGALTPPAELREQIRQVRKLTDQPFGVNLVLHQDLQPPRDPVRIPAEDIRKVQAVLNQCRQALGLPEKQEPPARFPDFVEGEISVLLDEKVPVWNVGLGNPSKDLVRRFHAQGAKVIAMICTPEDARTVAQSGVDAIIAQGSEAGGNRSTWTKRGPQDALIGLVPLTKAVVADVKVPVIAAGGIMDGRGLVAALSLGASAVLMGTRFIPTRESGATPAYKQAILDRSPDETTVTDAFTGMYARVLRNRYTESFAKAGNPSLPPFSQILASADVNAAALKNDAADYYALYAGQGVGQVRSITGAGDVVRAIVAEAEECLQELRNLKIRK